MSIQYAISGLPEARAYLAHPVLGPRLTECVAAMNSHTGLNAADILGDVDAQKFHSCVSLFATAEEKPGSVFDMALDRYFSGLRDRSTDAILNRDVRKW